MPSPRSWRLPPRPKRRRRRRRNSTGIEHAKKQEDGRYKGRKPSYTRKEFEAVQDLLAQDRPISLISRRTGLSRQTVYPIKEAPEEAVANLAEWGL